MKNLLDFKKNQTGRPLTAPCGGPHRVLLPFLTEDLYYLYHAHPNLASAEGRANSRPSRFRRLVQNSIALKSAQEFL
jgi:hypothetical protein